jgi:hypothetical protein
VKEFSFEPANKLVEVADGQAAEAVFVGKRLGFAKLISINFHALPCLFDRLRGNRAGSVAWAVSCR